MSPFDVPALKDQLDEVINYDLQRTDLWDDPEAAGKVLQKKKSLEKKINSYEKLEGDYEDINVLIEMAEEADDESLVPEIEDLFKKLKENIEDLRIETLLDGEYDKNNAILSIHAGSGGVDAQDWAEMLYRMYSRWIERKGFAYTLLDFQKDDEMCIRDSYNDLAIVCQIVHSVYVIVYHVDRLADVSVRFVEIYIELAVFVRCFSEY